MTGAEFRAALAMMGMSQRAFANRLSLHEITVSRWVRDERAVPPWVPTVLELLDRPGASRGQTT